MITLPQEIQKRERGLSDWCVLSGFRGSITHGMYVPKNDPNSIDDIDIMAICVPSKEHYLGLQEYGSRGTVEFRRDEWDIVMYEFRKMITMLKQGNPNVLSLLWLPEKYIIKTSYAGQKLIEHRHLFVGKHVYYSFIGYAQSQLKRMTHLAFNGYMGAKRKELVKQFGYDTKNAAHLVRLLRMGIEFLRNGELYVERPDAKELLEIKRGQWSLEQVQNEAERLFRVANEAHEQSTLPAISKREQIEILTVELIEETLRERGEL